MKITDRILNLFRKKTDHISALKKDTKPIDWSNRIQYNTDGEIIDPPINWDNVDVYIGDIPLLDVRSIDFNTPFCDKVDQLLNFYILKNKDNPTVLIIAYSDFVLLVEDSYRIMNLGFEIQMNRRFRGVKIIRTNDVDVGKLFFV